MGDRLFGGIGLLLAAFFIWQATQIQVSFISDPVGPKTFPIIIGLLLGISSLAVLLKPDPKPDWPAPGRLVEIGIAVLVLVVYAYSLPVIGFVFATAIAAAFLSWRLGTSPLQAIAAGAATSVGIYVVFHLILGLSLAEGPLGF
ncbi:MAG TPA: tripartite tricarboxylate transporter TctB family protein [Amaricoccus sp.]|uniref:tripartite tricarboxylate transporter TctB family protein n=1 Tax=Amaricoccus sp. TaxID=1872485 RepID=UPI001D676291|nr:tripartite tricarboxylate transporter TctB family protein [Amaricoccus sp.]MCB1372876.1 tripartite tricarboxylate transporter TctB family protein [Paracoccaceae bacterium]MCB1403772.1 tripartite tricarboxylate transporter TctB family protein [Paracoccaceae bacterium]HPG21492.1 tripartite tricarboxylate transporter TctB family protein [Amaricoccus sp.]HRW14442.1 tripartite tricarboxylate transporter TctB family protein [Amaricoccus sp.]